MKTWVLIGHPFPFTPGPHHEGVHGPFDPVLPPPTAEVPCTWTPPKIPRRRLAPHSKLKTTSTRGLDIVCSFVVACSSWRYVRKRTFLEIDKRGILVGEDSVSYWSMGMDMIRQILKRINPVDKYGLWSWSFDVLWWPTSLIRWQKRPRWGTAFWKVRWAK